MQKIVPHLWFDDQAEEAAALYTSIFQQGRTGRIARYGKVTEEVSGKPEGSVMTVEFSLCGQDFVGLNGGRHYQINPAISFFVECSSAAELDALWDRLAEGGMALMERGTYPWSDRYGWVQDRFGVSWQLSVGSGPQSISTFLMFCGDHFGQAEAAMKDYTALFENSGIDALMKAPDGTVQVASFHLAGQRFKAIDSKPHAFTFNPGISLLVNCDSQEEVDRLWEKLSANPQAEQCGWLEDRYGVSWQISPAVLDELIADPDNQKRERVLEAMLKMKKLDIAALLRAARGE